MAPLAYPAFAVPGPQPSLLSLLMALEELTGKYFTYGLHLVHNGNPTPPLDQQQAEGGLPQGK